MTRERKDLLLWRLALIASNTDYTIWERPIPIIGTENEDEQKLVYHALLKLRWLDPNVRRAVTRKLGLSHQKQKNKIENAVTLTMRYMLDQIKARMRENTKRPYGGVNNAAIAELAERLGMDVDTVTKRFYRLDHPEKEQLRKDREVEKRRRKRTDK
jgi:AraC-like DNA-binding protein